MISLIIAIIVLLGLLAVISFFPKFRNHPPHLSIIIPFREFNPDTGKPDDMTRNRVFNKVLEYYSKGLPEAEIIVAVDPLNAYPFNKSAAINAGVRSSLGRVIAVIDADCYIDCETIRTVARDIEEALDRREKLWYIPYERFYRLNKSTTLEILDCLSNPTTLKDLGDPPTPGKLDPSPARHSTGHTYGAMIQMMPREAFDRVGGWDILFSGWGSEDQSMLLALDTLYAPHKLFDGPVYHLWHHINFGSYEFTRTWIGQESPEQNWALANAYRHAYYDIDAMQQLCEDSMLAELARNEHLQTEN